MKHYVTFGQAHVHRIQNKLLHKDVVAVFEVENDIAGRKKAFELFGPKFCLEYPEKYWDEESMKYFPGGYVELE